MIDDDQPGGPVIVNPSGKPARKKSAVCPRCGAGPERREAATFGVPHPICTTCGYEFTDEGTA